MGHAGNFGPFCTIRRVSARSAGNFWAFYSVSGEIPARSAWEFWGHCELFDNYSCSAVEVHAAWSYARRFLPLSKVSFRRKAQTAQTLFVTCEHFVTNTVTNTNNVRTKLHCNQHCNNQGSTLQQCPPPLAMSKLSWPHRRLRGSCRRSSRSLACPMTTCSAYGEVTM